MVSIDPAGKLNEMREKMGLSFPTLLDPGSETIKRYGILKPDGDGLPHPTALIIDKKGIVRYKRVDEDYRVRPAARDLIEALGGM